jgi:hypothetical protein
MAAGMKLNSNVIANGRFYEVEEIPDQDFPEFATTSNSKGRMLMLAIIYSCSALYD